MNVPNSSTSEGIRKCLICEKRVKSFLRFFGRELKRKAKEKTLAFLISFFQKNVSQALLLSKNVFISKKSTVFFTEKEHTKRAVEKSSRTHTDRFCFLRRAAETERAVEKEQFFHLRKSSFFT